MKNQKGMDDVKPGPSSRVKGVGGQNNGSAKVISGGNKRGKQAGDHSRTKMSTTNRYPGNMGNS
jgi:hypothetical protein